MDPGASPESVKIAYRRLAREKHPDLVHHLGPAALADASAAMLVINEAYAVLSNARSRREYDSGAGRAAPAEPAEAAAEPTSAAPAAAPARARTQDRPGKEVLSSVVEVFSNRLRADLAAKVTEFKWRDRDLEGFHWAMYGSTWTSQYIVALRGFAAADLESAGKFTNYCDLALERGKGLIKQAYFLFFLPFQKASNTDMIMARLRRFCGDDSDRTPGPAMIVMTDVVRGKAVLCGPPVRDRHYERMLQALHLSRE